MDKMILVYVVCKDTFEAKNIGKKLLNNKLAACINIFIEGWSIDDVDIGVMDRRFK